MAKNGRPEGTVDHHYLGVCLFYLFTGFVVSVSYSLPAFILLGTEGGEFREFASKIKKGDVKNYLRLGNAAWIEKRLERAEEHYKRATEVDPEEPRAWHNLAICNYHLALKRNPDNLEGAVKSAYGPLKMAKEKGGFNYKSADETLAYLASQLGLIEEDSD